MKRALGLGALVSAAVVTGCSSAGRAEEAGPAVSRDFQVGAFERIEVAGPYEVVVTTGGSPAVHADGAQRDVEKMVVEVVNGTLRIHPRQRKGFNLGFSRHHGNVHLTVAVPKLSGAQIAGSGAISVDKVAGDSFEGGIAGSGGLQLGQVEVKRLKMSIAGSGEITAGSGRAAVADYEIAGSGDINAGELIADVAGVSIAGSGNVRAHATGTASVDIAGSGDVELTGGAKCNVSKAGSGDVRCS